MDRRSPVSAWPTQAAGMIAPTSVRRGLLRGLVPLALVAVLTIGCGGARSAEERAYLDYVERSNAVVGDSFLRFAQLTRDPKIGDDAWEQRFRDEAYLWQATYEGARSKTVPPKLEEIGAKLLEVLSLAAAAGQDNLDGLARLDVDLINRGTAKIDQATVAAKELTALLREYD